MNDVLCAADILNTIDDSRRGVLITVLDEIDSTNTFAKTKVADGVENGYVVVADKQTSGRGRRGNSFFSPEGLGIYLSIVLRADLVISNAVKITTAASVAVANAIREVTGIKPGIKWVNDIYIGGKKVCGILTESVLNDNNKPEAVVVGVGINVEAPANGYPSDIRDIATSLRDAEIKCEFTRNDLIGEIVKRMLDIWDNICDGKEEYLQEYREMSIVLGREITFIDNSDKKPVKMQGTAVEIDQNGGLVTELKNGEIITLSSGEISVRVW